GGLNTPRSRRGKLGRCAAANLEARLWCSATRPGPSASSLQSIATAQGHPTASVSARAARGSSGPSVEAANFHMFPLDEGTGEVWLTLCRELSAARNPRPRRHRCRHRNWCAGPRHGASRQEHVAITTHDDGQRHRARDATLAAWVIFLWPAYYSKLAGSGSPWASKISLIKLMQTAS